MCKISELKKDIIENKDVISILRKAKVVSTTYKIDEMTKWIDLELNGYRNVSDIPDYRNIVGVVKARNPIYGLIPVIMPASISKEISSRKLFNPISEILSFSNSDDYASIQLPSELSEALCKNEGVHYPCYLIISKSSFLSIIENVKNYIFEWCLKLEKENDIPNDTSINESKKENNTISQQTIVCENFFNGDANSSQIVSGNNNNIFSGNDLSKLVEEIKKSILTELKNEKKKDEALEILEDINESIKAGKKKSIIMSALGGLRDFLINAGAAIAAAVITKNIGSF